MKSITLALLAALTATSFAADTPADIAADYREKAAVALKRVNETLEKAGAPLVASLIRAGDTAGADLLNAQLKAKIAGEPVANPQPSVTALFQSYDAARAKALEPVQKSALARIDAALASSDGKKLDVVSELGKVRADVEAGKVATTPVIVSKRIQVPERWTYHMTLNDRSPLANISLKPDGEFTMSGNEPGRWEQSKIDGRITITFGSGKNPWIMTLNGDDTAMLDRSDTGRRFMRVRK